MGRDPIEQLLGIVGRPRETLERLLVSAIAGVGARGGAVLRDERGQAPRVLVARGLSAEAILALRTAVPRAHGRSRPAGEAILFLEGEERPPDDFFLLAIGAAARQLLSTETSAEAGERAAMEKLLAEEQWNLARVARALGIARRTVYLRLERLGIKRKRPPRTLASDTLRYVRTRTRRDR